MEDSLLTNWPVVYKNRHMKKTATLLLVPLLFLFFVQNLAIAKADDLVIEEDGSIILIVSDTKVLGTTDPNTPGFSLPPGKKAEVKKVETIVQPKEQSKVEIKPSAKNDKKLNITITPTPAGPQPAKPNVAPTPSAEPITKSVDNVVLRNANKETVLNIKSDKSNNLTIEQNQTQAKTNLPVQIDTKSHEISVTTTKGQENVQVLPDQALKSAEDKETSFVKNLGASETNVRLTQIRGSAVYEVDEIKTGKFLGVLSVSLPNHIKISAETGKTLSVWQSPVSIFLGFLIK